MEIILGFATILGGLTAVWFFWDKYNEKNHWVYEDKQVNNNWFELSDLKKTLETEGFTFRWSNVDAIEERKQKGYKIIYEEDKQNKRKYRLVNKSGQVLIGRKPI